MGFNIDDYETVDTRIKKFYKQYPEGRILTKLISPATDIKTVVFKAYIHNKDKLLSTGHAYETAGQGYVNKTSHLENCETSAIGRGLANIGLSGDKRPTQEEMKKPQQTEKIKNINQQNYNWQPLSKKQHLIQQIQKEYKKIKNPSQKQQEWVANLETHSLKALEKGLQNIQNKIKE